MMIPEISGGNRSDVDPRDALWNCVTTWRYSAAGG